MDNVVLDPEKIQGQTVINTIIYLILTKPTDRIVDGVEKSKPSMCSEIVHFRWHLEAIYTL